MTKETQILDWLETQLKTILPGNGFNTAAGQRVYRNLQYSFEEQTFPLICLFAGDNKCTYDGDPLPCIGQQNHFFEIGIEGIVKDTERGDEAEKLRADLVKLLWVDPAMGGLADGFTEGVLVKSKTENSGETGIISYVQAGFTLRYTTPRGQI